MPEDSTLDSFFGPAFSRFFVFVRAKTPSPQFSHLRFSFQQKRRGRFFTRAHTLQSSRAHRRGHKTRGSPAEEEEEEEEEEETDPRRPEDEDDDDDGGGGGDARHQGLED